MMQAVRVRLFARLQEIAGSDMLELALPIHSCVQDLRTALRDQVPKIAELLARSQIAVNNEFVGEGAPLSANDEIAIIPPVSGGS